MQKDHLITISIKLWPQIRHLFEGARIETGTIVLLYRMSGPRCLHPGLVHELKVRKLKLSSIIHTFSVALYEFATPY